MLKYSSRKTKVAAVWLAIFATGLVVAWFAQKARREQMLADLVDDAKRAAVAFEPGAMRRLTATKADAATPAYEVVKDRLRKLQGVNPNVRFVYLFRSTPQPGRVVFLADSAVPGAKDESLPGDDYPQAATSPGLQEILRTGKPATEGPLADDFGTWVTAYALVGEAADGAGGVLHKDILGLDLDAAHWRRELFTSGFHGALYVWLLFGAPWLAFQVRRRQDEQRGIIRNLSEAMEQSKSAIMIIDLESRIEFANRGLCQQLGFTRRELLGRKWKEFHVPQTSDEMLSDLVATVRAGRTWEGEWFNKRKDGSVYPVRGAVTPVKKRDGALACFVAIFDDVTQSKSKEDELRDARDLAEAGDRAKGQFLATMSHEVRTPLNGIVGFTSLLLETPLSSEQREYVQTVKMSTEALIQLTGDILDFARIDSGKLKLEPLACDPRECIEDALDLLAAKAAGKKIELLHRVAPDVPSAVVTDGGRLRQVLVNLLGNAVKFTEKGEVVVSLRVLRETSMPFADLETQPATAGSQPETAATPAAKASDREPHLAAACILEFSVSDTGIGIAKENQSRLFKPFSQVDESTTRRYGGTGLGLAISRNLVHLMGGQISLTSEAGQGSTFTFTIRVPVAAAFSPVHDLAGMRVGLALWPGAQRRELAQLLADWKATPIEADTPAELGRKQWDVAVVEVNEEFAHTLAERTEPMPGVPPAQAFGLVPITLSNDLRTALRVHFRLLVNKPLHHEAFFALLTGSRAPSAGTVSPVTHFGFRVLVAEDNPVNQKLMQRVLTNLGCTWKVLENGLLAIQELTEHSMDYDVVLLDLHMPEMDGMTALKEIRLGKAGVRAQTMWIIALTADAREEQRVRGLAAGLNDYLTKPVKLADVETALRRFRTERGSRKR